MSIISNFYKVSFLFVFGFFLQVSTAFAQEKSSLPTIDFVVDFAYVDTNIDEGTAQKIKEQVKVMMQRYAYSSSFGEYTGEYSSEKYEMFSKLFTNNARLTNYILKKPIQQETFKYIGFIYDNIRPKSLDQKFRTGELLSIEKDASGNFRCSIFLSMDVSSIYDDKTKKLSSSPKSRRVDLKALAILEPGHFEGGTFVEMIGEGCINCSESKIMLTTGISYGIGSLSGGSNSRGFSDVKPTTSAIGLYADLSKSIGSSGKWHLWLGLGYQSLNVTTDITGKFDGRVSLVDTIIRTAFVNDNFPKGSTTSQVTINSLTSGEEKISGATLLSGVIGVGYQMKVGLKNKLMIRMGLAPTYLSGVSKGNRNIEFDGYELPLASNFPTKEELDDNLVGDAYNFKNGVPQNLVTADNNFSLTAIIAPSIQIPIGFSWGLDLGMSYTFGINNLFKHVPTAYDFLAKENGTTSIIQDFLPSSKHNQLQVRAGVFLNLN